MVPDGTGIKIQAGGGCKHEDKQKDRHSVLILIYPAGHTVLSGTLQSERSDAVLEIT